MIKIPCLTGTQTKMLVEAAGQTALRFCAPIYLVGSALHSEYPNDIDIYVVVKSDTYLRLFTNYNKKTESESDHMANIAMMQKQQARIYSKQKNYYEKYIKGWDFDIKFQNDDTFFKTEGPRLRLDYIYKGIW